MATLSLAEIPGIGPKAQARLAGVGLVNVTDVLAHDIATLTRWLDRQTAEWLHARARGEARAAVEPRAPVRGMSREETFDRDLVRQDELESELRHLARKVASDMRDEGLAARTITVKLKSNDFVSRTASRTLTEPVESDRAVVDTAVALLTQLRLTNRKPARLVGVGLSNFKAGRDAEQLAMAFAPPPPEPGTIAAGPAPAGTVSGPSSRAQVIQPVVELARDRDLSRAIDRVRERFGDDAIRSGKPRRRPVGEKGARKPRDGR